MKSWTIAALARGVDVETVRYYQRRGLLRVLSRQGTNIRRYDTDDLRRLHFIREAQTAGFTPGDELIKGIPFLGEQ
jgi:MerR family transcriptional regulator, mercuric resistance operon regulatory protein